MKSLKDYNDLNATREVIGCLMKDPSLIKKYEITCKMFVDKFYQYIYLAIENLYLGGAKVVDVNAIIDYLSQYKTHYKNFMNNQGDEVLSTIVEICEPYNFEYNFNLVKKFALLRDYVSNGIEVKEYFDPEDYEVDIIDKKRQRLEKESIEEIVAYYRQKQNNITAIYENNTEIQTKKAGVGGIEQLEKWKQQTAWGLGYASAYLTTALYGIRQRRYNVMSAGTGTGKTRTSIANICHAFTPKYYNKEAKKWCVNPNGTHNKCLYIGTEMELIDEIDPILWAYIADVPQQHIEFNQYEDDEEDRVREAIRILEEEGNIYLAYCPEYNVDILKQLIEEHKMEYGITSVFFDYIHSTSELIAEFSAKTNKNMAVREDQVLLDLSKKIKNICKYYNVSFDTCTQVSGDFKNTENRDSSIVRGSKAIIDKADIGMIAMPPTEKELKLVDNLLHRGNTNTKALKILPNPHNTMKYLVYNIYKNRGGQYNKIKIWTSIDYSTMRVHDLFVTDYDYKVLNIPKTYINIYSTDNVTYDEGKTIFVDDISVVNNHIKDIKQDIGLDSYIDECTKAENEMAKEIVKEQNQNNHDMITPHYEIEEEEIEF